MITTITRFDTAEGACDEAMFRADFEQCAQAICGDEIGYRVLPLSDVVNRSATIEIFRPREQM